MKTRRIRLALCVLLLSGTTLAAQFTFTTLHHFGESPLIGQRASPLARGPDGTLYGVTKFGGAKSGGVLYRLSADGSTRSILHEFGSIPNGGTEPDRAVLPASNGFLYGFTRRGSTNNLTSGVLYRVATNGAGYTVLRHLPSFGDGYHLIEASNGRIYGLTGTGLIAFDADGGNFSTLFTNVFTDTDSLFEGHDGMLYMVEGSDSIDVTDGALYRINLDGSNLTVLRARIPFRGVVGNNSPFPCCAFQGADGFIYGMEDVGGDSYFFRTDTNVATSASNWVEQGSLNLLGFQHLPTSFFQASDGRFYGSFSQPYIFAPQGYLFRWDSWGTLSTTRTNLVDWSASILGPFGGTPAKTFLEGSDGRFYGVVDGGGRHGAGLVFRVNKDGTDLTRLHEFFENDGSNAAPPVILGSDGYLYGTTREGGLQGLGTIYRVRPDGSDYNMIRRFFTRDEGADPAGGVIDGQDGFLYGATASGGSQNFGTIYKLRYDGSEFAVMYNIRTNRPNTTSPRDPTSITASLTMDTNGWLYGVGTTNGSAGRGGVFRAHKDGTLFTNLHNFIVGEARRPVGGLRLALDGRLWGTTENGGANDSGVLYRLNTDGTGFQILRAFGGTNDGANPSAPLWQAAGGIFYGTTFGGGTNNFGTVFRYNPVNSNYTVLHHFGAGTDGRRPSAGLVETSDGTLVGATRFGGSGAAGQQLGTLYKLNKDGTAYEVLRSFTGESGDGESVFSTLTKGLGDAFFGTTSIGGNRDLGTVFSFTLGGTLPPPTIIAPPTSFISAPGGVVTLAVQASGTLPLSYQWFFRGIAIDGATNTTLTLTNTATDAGAYTVRITNPNGSINSAPAYVTLFGINSDRSLMLLGEPGVAYRIEFTDAFTVPPQNWQVLTNVTLPLGQILIQDASSGVSNQRFYRGVLGQ
jgi:uncharacterized repeat protein (TIGR03803 family)